MLKVNDSRTHKHLLLSAFTSFALGVLVVLLTIYGRFSFYFSFFIIMYSVIAWITVVNMMKKVVSLDLMNPGLVFIGVYTIYGWAAAFLVEMSHGVIYQGRSVGFDAQVIYYFSITIGLAGFAFGFGYLTNIFNPLVRLANSYHEQISDSRFISLLGKAAFLITIISIGNLLDWLGVGKKVLPYTEIAGISRLVMRADIFSGVKAFLSNISIYLLISALLLQIGKNKFWNLTILLFLLMAVMASLARGERAILILIAFTLLLFYHYKIRRLKWTEIVLPALLLYVILGSIQHVRNKSDIPQMVKAGVSLIWSNPLLLLPSNIGEFSAPSGSFLVLIDGIQHGVTDFGFGKIYLIAIAEWIPRPLFPDRPLPLPELFMSIFFPNQYLSGRGFGFFIPMEGYWALGLPGVFLDLAFFGAILAAVYRFFLSNMHRPSAFLFYIITFPALVIISVRSGMIGTLKYSLMISAPLILLIILAGIERQSNPVRNNP